MAKVYCGLTKQSWRVHVENEANNDFFGSLTIFGDVGCLECNGVY